MAENHKENSASLLLGKEKGARPEKKKEVAKRRGKRRRKKGKKKKGRIEGI